MSRTLPKVSTYLSRLLRPPIAVVMIASFVAWRPAMTATMSAMPHDMNDRVRHPEPPQHRALPRDCCSSCVCACAAVAGLAVAATIQLRGSIDYVPAAPDRTGVTVLAAPHRLPFSIGPPLHLS